ncbi:hypothetical protein PHLGIDRAFT_355177 [Phlebiopsis gigantea 11061_1 CR5-6]|uniref:Uncharacterized protein n=1 Tax=Phlebiopsis gigantea (strain 11061_1 CR5-6) TaxID=745531 RepID=A0A0C3SA73_PHLG1|nr:hypothetical protein PHLGIDRAFT_355177 [Phlebiopsis gigantea 11061_1 CR5-6]
MYTFVHERFLNYYGQRGARLRRNESVHTTDVHRESSYLFLLARPFLFYTPDIYIRKLHEIWVDDQVNEGPWNKFWGEPEIRRDWERTFTPVTVLLSTNVGFLAISSVDNSAAGSQRSVSQIASYVSTVLSLGSYVMWWILSRQHPPDAQETAKEAATYLSGRSGNRLLGLGLEADALMYRHV